MAMPKFDSVDDYIASFTKDIQARLEAIRKIIKEEAPQATEKISYGIPYYSLNGQLIYFAAFKNHIGLYPMKSTIKEFNTELSVYPTSAGTIQFSHDKTLPLGLIRKIVKFRVNENAPKTSN